VAGVEKHILKQVEAFLQ
jgi:PHS family inorganic phosphate transporter-like MFS transporter